MKSEDIYELKLGQKIWWKEKEYKISALGAWRIPQQSTIIYFQDYLPVQEWDLICSDCSLEPPKQAEKIKLFRYTYRRPNNREISQTNWTDCSWGLYFNSLYGTADLLLTEEKEIIL